MDILNFPLLHLAQNAILKVLGTMDILELFILSTLSRKSKMLVKSLNFEFQRIGVKIEKDTISLLFIFLGDALNMLNIKIKYDFPVNRKSHLMEPHHASLYQRNFREVNAVPIQYRFPEKLGWLEWWMDLVKSSFRFAEVPSVWLRKNQFEFQSIWKTFGEHFTYLNIDERIPLENKVIILETLRTSKTLPICEVGYVQVPIRDQVLIGNFDRSNIRKDIRPWKIDDILQINAKEIEIYRSEFTEKELNILLKFWMKGVWPRLEKMKFRLYGELNGEVRRLDEKELLRGIKHQKASSERKNVFLTQHGINIHVTGGWDIRRKDGTKATVKIKIDEREVYVSWYIWHPHCIGKEE